MIDNKYQISLLNGNYSEVVYPSHLLTLLFHDTYAMPKRFDNLTIDHASLEIGYSGSECLEVDDEKIPCFTLSFFLTQNLVRFPDPTGNFRQFDVIGYKGSVYFFFFTIGFEYVPNFKTKSYMDTILPPGLEYTV